MVALSLVDFLFHVVSEILRCFRNRRQSPDADVGGDDVGQSEPDESLVFVHHDLEQR